MNRVEQDKLFFKEAKRQISKLKKDNAEMLEALKDAEKIILKVHQYGLIGGLDDHSIDTLENIQSILKDLE